MKHDRSAKYAIQGMQRRMSGQAEYDGKCRKGTEYLQPGARDISAIRKTAPNGNSEAVANK